MNAMRALRTQRRIAAAPLARLDAAGVASLERLAAVDEHRQIVPPLARRQIDRHANRFAGGEAVARSARRRRRCRSPWQRSVGCRRCAAQTQQGLLHVENSARSSARSASPRSASRPPRLGTGDKSRWAHRLRGRSGHRESRRSPRRRRACPPPSRRSCESASRRRRGRTRRRGLRATRRQIACFRPRTRAPTAFRSASMRPSTANSYGNGAEGRVPASCLMSKSLALGSRRIASISSAVRARKSAGGALNWRGESLRGTRRDRDTAASPRPQPEPDETPT